MKIRIADYIAQAVSTIAKNCYMVTGGGAMHLNDAFSKTDMQIIFCHHEQACSIAAEAEARITNIPAVVNVTTGPGGINAINGVFGAFVDSIPMIVVSGQVKRETLVEYMQGSWRQLGDQEVNIIEMVKKITKYAVCILDPLTIKYHVEKAIFEATNGRPGPVWIDVPIDIQAMQNDMDELTGFEIPIQPIFNKEKAYQQFIELNSILQNAQKPVIYVGAGIHLSSTKDLLLKFIELLEIPVVTSFNSNDIIEDENQFYVGRGGTIGNRSGNFVLQSADVIIVLGSRLNIRQVSYNWNSFAPKSLKIGIDIDINELNKPTCNFNIKIHSSLQYF
ncbi:MAG: thiamine pyrophosphate-binding protein, partial [Sediminibacterium sp.]|nr:thiamine pyrophosphate-binding protein [Sediminibacterium sp.]